MSTQRSVNQDTPAYRVIQKCGGFSETARLAGTSESWVYRWTYDEGNGGTGGRIPAKAQQALLEAARVGGCNITPADFFEAAPARQGAAQ